MAKTYTYIGGGADAPQLINFMGKQEFMIGDPTEVTDPEVLAKIGGNQCFVEGEADRKEIIKEAKKAQEKAAAQLVEDKMVNAREMKRRNKK